MVREGGLSPETRSMHCTDYASRSFDTCFFTLTSKKGLETVASDFQTVCCHADAYQCSLQIRVAIQAEEKVPFLHACITTIPLLNRDSCSSWMMVQEQQ